MRRIVKVTAVAAALAGLVAAGVAFADSVAQVSTAKRISRQTVALIDPQTGRPAGDGGTDTVTKVGDVLTFVIQFTPVPNGAYRGLGGYITDYIPGNTEVVGARIIDRNGNTVSPHRGGLAADGVGPRGPSNYATLPGGTTGTNGSMSQLYADTGVFFSTDPRTSRQPATGFLTFQNGLVMSPEPTGAGGLKNILGVASPVHAHNAWDLAQVMALGVGAAVNGGQGNTPEHVGNLGIGYGSAVAGPDTWYQLEASIDPPTAAISTANAKFLGNVGPWKRIRTTGGEIGRRGAGNTPPLSTQVMPDPGLPTRVGVPAVDGTGALLGWNLSPDNPLPSGADGGVRTNAVRFALGELVVGDEYYAEISLRVKGLPLDPASGMDVNCAEVTGGDASARDQNGTGGGKDNTWRYFLPAPSCVMLNLLFENTVDKVLALSGSTLTYTIEVKNLSTAAQQNVVVRDCYDPADEVFVAAGTTAGYTLDNAGTGCPNPAVEDALVWNVGTMAPGATNTFTVTFTANNTATNRAVYTSQALPAPGFVATAFTTIASVAVMRLDLTAAPSYLAVAPGTVHYTAKVNNVGTGPASFTGCSGVGCYVEVELPAGFTYKAGTTMVDGAAVTQNPTQMGRRLRFLGVPLLPASIAASGVLTLEFDVDVPTGTVPGVYPSNLSTWTRSAQDFEDALFGVAPVAVGRPRSDPPVVNAPITQGATTVSGTTTEAAGSMVRVFVNGNPAGSGVSAAGGTFSVTVPTLIAGQRVTATVEAPGEFESAPSAPVVVQGVGGVAACSDGNDNDGDGKTDFPADPGCLSANDIDETDVPQCSDGADNDGDTQVDYPNDPGCSSFVDNSEVGAAACADGADNDGDGKTDFPGDPGCTSASDTSEADIPACADGTDNDGDGKVDYPDDPGCAFAVDDDEADGVTTPPDGGISNDGGTGGGGAGDAGAGPGDAGEGASDAGDAPDAGNGAGDAGEGGDIGVAKSGCGCSTNGTAAPLIFFAVALGWARRRRTS
ncbi:MAG: MYXO-CTERM sorting domain-containing protein [Myxococcota bacterium]